MVSFVCLVSSFRYVFSVVWVERIEVVVIVFTLFLLIFSLKITSILSTSQLEGFPLILSRFARQLLLRFWTFLTLFFLVVRAAISKLVEGGHTFVGWLFARLYLGYDLFLFGDGLLKLKLLSNFSQFALVYLVLCFGPQLQILVAWGSKYNWDKFLVDARASGSRGLYGFDGFTIVLDKYDWGLRLHVWLI